MYSIQFHEDRKCETPEQKAKSMALAIAKAAADENHFSMLMRFTRFPHHWVPFQGPHEQQVLALQQDLMTKSRRNDDFCLMCSCCAVQATESPPTAWPILLRCNL